MFSKLQKLGRALMNPVAVLPVAAILVGVGYALDPVGWGEASPIAALLIKSGTAILDHLGIIFAVGVAYGLSKDRDGAAAFSGLVAFLMVTSLLSPASVAQFKGVPVEAIPATAGFQKIDNVFIGMLSGIVGSFAYNRFSNVQLPDWLAFFSGRRSAPIVTSFIMLFVSGILFFVWPALYSGLVAFGTAIQKLGPLGAGIYGFANKLLIPTGLHHALNSVFWFDTIGINDIPNFLGRVPSTVPGVTTGMYQAGFFPIMMFGLPGAALAMYRQARPERRAVVRSLFIAGAFATFFTGVTEPIEFSFMFLAPGLYLLHAVLTGISLFIAASMKWMAGFGFSAGAIDLALSIRNPLATKWYMLIVQGLVFFGLYYAVFTFAIKKWNLMTPGREEIVEETTTTSEPSSSKEDMKQWGATLLEAVGGHENLESFTHCVTRLRMEVKDPTKVDMAKIKSTPVSGVIQPSKHALQIVIGPQVQFLYDEMNRL